jgi:outer membrane protein assembly factor BamB
MAPPPPRTPPTTPPLPSSSPPPPPGTATKRWTVPVPIWVNAIAAVGDTVYVGGDGAVLALNRADGTGRWRYTAPHSGGPEAVSLYAADGTVCVDTRGALIALDPATGRERWRRVAEAPSGYEEITPAPGTVYAGEGQALIALDDMTGTERWRHVVAGKFARYATADGERVFVSNGSGVDAVDVATGELHWRYRRGEGTGNNKLAVADATVFVDNDYGGMVAPDATSGDVRWEAPLDADHPSSERPVVVDGVVVVLSSDEQLIALDMATGAVRWDGTGSALRETAQVGPFASADPADRFVYAAGESGHVIAVEAATGARHWTYPAPVDDVWLKAFAVSDGTAFAGTTDEVWAIGPA